MGRTIELKKRYVCVGDVWQELLNEGFDLETVNAFCNKLPTADVEEVSHGEWEPYIQNNYQMGWTCSICGRHCGAEKEPYCHCGAKMDGKSKGEKSLFFADIDEIIDAVE